MAKQNLPSCSRRMFLLGTATTFAGAFLVACGENPSEEIAATEVPVGSAVILSNIIIAQPIEGQFVAYSASCPHQQQKITEVEGNTVRCTAHSSIFDLEDGSVLKGPSRDPLKPAKLEAEGGTLKARL